MKAFSRIVASVAAVVGLSKPLHAQSVTLNFDDVTPCSGTQLSTYQNWLSLLNPAPCQSGNYAWLSASSGNQYLRGNGNMGWMFLNSPVTFNGMWVSGWGTFFMEILSGGSTVYTQMFTLAGGRTQISSGYNGQSNGVRLGIVSGIALLGVDDVSFRGPQADPPPPADPADNVNNNSVTPPEDPLPPEEDPVTNLVNEPTANPEPATMLLVASGLGGIGAMARRRQRKRNT